MNAVAESIHSQRELYLRGMVLDAVARLLPFVGRDLRVDVRLIPNKTPDGRGATATSIQIYGLTEMGKAVVPVIRQLLEKELRIVETERAAELGAKRGDGGQRNAGHVAEQSDDGRVPGGGSADDAQRDVPAEPSIK